MGSEMTESVEKVAIFIYDIVGVAFCCRREVEEVF
jgi:hypothetical protein